MFGTKELNDLSDAYNVNVEHSFLNFRATLCNCYFNLALKSRIKYSVIITVQLMYTC